MPGSLPGYRAAFFLMAFVRAARPHQCTFVPDSESQPTSDHGWDLTTEAPQLQACGHRDHLDR